MSCKHINPETLLQGDTVPEERGRKVMKRYEILAVDNNHDMLSTIAGVLEDKGYLATTASSEKAAIDALSVRDFDLVLSDLNMPQTGGLVVLKKAKELHPDSGFIMVTGNRAVTWAIDALRLGADDYVLKPFCVADLLERVATCLQKVELRRRNRQSWLRSHRLDDQRLNVLMMMLHDTKRPVAARAAVLKLLIHGMDERVSDMLKVLFAKIAPLTDTPGGSSGKGLSVEGSVGIERDLINLRAEGKNNIGIQFQNPSLSEHGANV